MIHTAPLIAFVQAAVRSPLLAGLDTKSLGTAAKPGDHFECADGGWRVGADIPPDRSFGIKLGENRYLPPDARLHVR